MHARCPVFNIPPLLTVSPLIPKLLVSVQNTREAAEALRGGADWIDVKQPAEGSLGRPTDLDLAQVVHLVAARLPLSVALGELHQMGANETFTQPCWTEIGRVKIGLSGCRSQEDWRDKLGEIAATLPVRTQLVAVQYTDWRTCDAPSPVELLEFARDVRCATLLVDTFDKRAGGLFDWMSEVELAQLFAQAHEQNMLCVAAGSLTAERIPAAIDAGADVIAVRGAVCERGVRTSAVSAERVRALRKFFSARVSEIS